MKQGLLAVTLIAAFALLAAECLQALSTAGP